MPLQNRVQPDGQIIATAARGTLTGNRGILHGPDKVLGRARWTHKAWICCTLAWQGRKRAVMTGRNWTELFFLDEAVALAAGHRPCAYCRRADYTRFRDAWAKAFQTDPRAPQMDAALHTARLQPRTRDQRTHHADAGDLPDGTFIRLGGQPHLIWQDACHPYHPGHYGAARSRPKGEVNVMTPAPIVSCLAAGYAPIVHHSVDLSPNA